MYKEKFDFKDKLPPQKFVLPYILMALHSLGGEARGKDVIEELIKRFDLSDELIEKKAKSGERLFPRIIYFGRYSLDAAGYVNFPEKEIWGLTKEGKQKIKELKESDGRVALDEFRSEVGKKKTEKLKKAKTKKEKAQSDIEDDTEDDEILSEEESLEESKIQKDLGKIQNLDPFAFERLCARLLKAAGYEDAEPTRESKDEGIDGIGYLSLGLIRFKVAFQSKRFKDGNKVTQEHINAFAGAAKEKVEKTIFITTSDFTSGARKAAERHKMDLINGEKLMELLFKYEIGYSKNFDEDFFENI